MVDHLRMAKPRAAAQTSMKKSYEAPTLLDFGTVADLTAAVGSSTQEDQSEFPEQFPPDGGSFDICDNDDTAGVC